MEEEEELRMAYGNVADDGSCDKYFLSMAAARCII